MRIQLIAARLSLIAFLAALAVCLTAAFGTRLGYWQYATGFRILWPGAAIGAVAALSGMLWMALALRNNDRLGWRWGFAGLIGAIVLLYSPLRAASLAWGAPPIHDISTDVEYAPAFKALLPLRGNAANGPEYDGPKKVVLKGKITTVAELQKLNYPDIKPEAKLLNPHNNPGIHPQAVLFWRAFERAKEMGWNIVAFDAKTGVIEATDTTFWFGFTDDIAIRVVPAGSLGAKLDIRSKSRIGTTDYGRNAERIRDYLKGL